MINKIQTIIISALLILTVSGCSAEGAQSRSVLPDSSSQASSPSAEAAVSADTSSMAPEVESSEASSGSVEPDVSELTVQFGDNGASFIMHLYDNSTAAAIADYVGTADWRLPIYNFDGYENWEVMQYYDLPGRYEIPSSVETITDEKAGEVYYSEPNRIVLFYGDAKVTGEYSRVGYFEATEDFVAAVKGNPVLEGWGNKIVLIKE